MPEPRPSSDDLRFEIEESPQETIVRCTGKIVSDTCNVFQEQVRRLISDHRSITIDLSKVTSIDSAGLGALVAMWSSAKKRSAEVDIRWRTARGRLMRLT